MGGPRQITPNGYDAYECMSALQKAIRRGWEEQAIHWAFELEAHGWWKAMHRRLRVIANEDVGIGDMVAVTFAMTMFAEADKSYPDNGNWRLPLTNAILALSRATKSRIGDHAVIATMARARAKLMPPVPEVALDKHTMRGKRMKRGFKHFLDEGSILDPMAEIPDPFKGDYEFECLRRDGQPGIKWGELAYGQIPGEPPPGGRRRSPVAADPTDDQPDEDEPAVDATGQTSLI